MALIKKQVTGIAEELKLVKNSKSAPKTAMGGSQRTSFKGSDDNRSAGAAGPNQVLKGAEGYVNQGATYIGDVSHSRSFTKAGTRGSLAGKVSTASENVTGGMGGRFIKEPGRG